MKLGNLCSDLRQGGQTDYGLIVSFLVLAIKDLYGYRPNGERLRANAIERDLVAGAYRGSAGIERCIDATDPNIPDFAKGVGDGAPLGRVRFVPDRQFEELCTLMTSLAGNRGRVPIQPPAGLCGSVGGDALFA